MTMYYFNIHVGAGGVFDPDGTELPDRAAAREHATEVIRELLRFDEARKRTWRLDVCDKRGTTLFEVPFSTVDPSLDHLQAPTRDLVERVCESRRRLAETLFRLQALRLQARPTQDNVARGPYLIAESGRRVAFGSGECLRPDDKGRPIEARNRLVRGNTYARRQ
jgi:hypothetical protein